MRRLFNERNPEVARIAYVNGRYLRHQLASVHIEDRGYQFSDAAYEVIPIIGTAALDTEPHLDRLARSLRELSIDAPASRPAMRRIILEVIRRNRLSNGIVYIQVSRGVAPRDHAFPKNGVRPAMVMTAKRLDFDLIRKRQAAGVSITTHPEIRWRRPDIKSVSLLGNVLAKESASGAGAYEAWFVDDEGFVTEGTSTNAWMVSKRGTLVTRELGQAILPGITRAALFSVADDMKLDIEERAFALDELLAAPEAFLTSSTNFVMPVVRVNDTVIGDGQPGKVAKGLAKAYWDYVDKANG